MTVTAAEPQATATPSRRRGVTPLTPMRQAAAKSMTKLADGMKDSHPDLSVHQHVRDAARMLRAGQEEAAQRHLRAAMFALTPQSLMRNGIHTDDPHVAARDAMHRVHRHLLLVKDIADVAAKNRAAINRDSYGDLESSPSLPSSPVHADPNAGYGPGALAQKPTARQPGGDRALNAPARTNSGGADPAAADPQGPQPKGSKQFATWDEAGHAVGRAIELGSEAWDWDDLGAVIVELSARTAQLEVTPAPYGKPAGPGLYDIKGNKHSDYFEQIVKALREKRGMSKGRASAIAYGALRKWARGGGKVHPEVRAAATGALAEEKAKGAAAKAAHGHAVTWDDLGGVVELAVSVPVAGWDGAAAAVELATTTWGSVAVELAKVIDLFNPAGNPNQPRNAAGKFTQGQQSAPAKGKGGQPQKGRQPPPKGAKAAHAKHVAHVQHLARQAQQKANLLKQARQDRVKAAGIMKQITNLQKIIAAAQAGTGKTVSSSSNVTKATTGSTTAASPSTKAAAASTASTASGTASTASSTASATAKATAASKQLGPLQQQYKTLMASAAKAQAQAAKL